MNTVFITYDLKAPGSDYSKLFEKIKSFGTWWHCIESCWIVKTNKSAASVRDELKEVIDSNDLLFVHTSLSWASQNLSDECNNWLKENF